MEDWTEYGGGISDEDTEELKTILKKLNGALNRLNKAQDDAVAAADSVTSVARAALKVISFAAPIVSQRLLKNAGDSIKNPDNEFDIVAVTDVSNLNLAPALLNTLTKIKV